MLRVRAEQMKAFETQALRAFEDEMVAHSKEFAPHLSAVLGDAQLRVAVQTAIAKAGEYGFTLRGPIRLFVELTFLFGSGFHDDPQYPVICEVLRSEADEMTRADRLHEWHNEYLETVAGPANINVRRALESVDDFARNTPAALERNLDDEILRGIARAFPERATSIGENALRALVAEGKEEAAKYGFTTARGKALLIILKASFGHRCTDDALYPWIRQTLVDPQIADAAARAQRLERKSRTWLSHVLARPQPGMPE